LLVVSLVVDINALCVECQLTVLMVLILHTVVLYTCAFLDCAVYMQCFSGVLVV